MSIDSDKLNNCKLRIEDDHLTIRTPNGQLVLIKRIKSIGHRDGIYLGDLLEPVIQHLRDQTK